MRRISGNFGCKFLSVCLAQQKVPIMLGKLSCVLSKARKLFLGTN